MKNLQRKVKYTVHRNITTKPEYYSTGFPKVVQISVTDPCATDSSSDEEEDHNNKSMSSPKPTRVKRYVEEIRFVAKREKLTSKPEPVKYRGVRQRPWGKFAAEIRDPNTKTRIWIGTFNTAREAAIGYDKAAIRLKGHNAQTNLLTHPPCPNTSPVLSETTEKTPVIDVETVSGTDSARESSLCSPTSVLRYDRTEETDFRRIEPVKLTGNDSTVKEDSFFLPDLFLGGDCCYWDDESQFCNDSLFLDELESLPNNNNVTISSKDSLGDFGLCSWDEVDEFVRGL